MRASTALIAPLMPAMKNNKAFNVFLGILDRMLFRFQIFANLSSVLTRLSTKNFIRWKE